MKSKRWKRRNRHTRPEWVNAYVIAQWSNSSRLKSYYGPIKGGKDIKMINTSNKELSLYTRMGRHLQNKGIDC